MIFFRCTFNFLVQNLYYFFKIGFYFKKLVQNFKLKIIGGILKIIGGTVKRSPLCTPKKCLFGLWESTFLQIREVKFVLKIYLASLENWYIMYQTNFIYLFNIKHTFKYGFNYVCLEGTVYFGS